MPRSNLLDATHGYLVLKLLLLTKLVDGDGHLARAEDQLLDAFWLLRRGTHLGYRPICSTKQYITLPYGLNNGVR